MDITIRSAVLDDAGFLADMLVEAASWGSHRDVTRADVLSDPHLGRYLDGWPAAGDLGVLAEHDAGDRLGAAWLRLFTPAHPGYGFVEADVPELAIGVRAQWRGHGLGSQLLTALTATAADVGIRRVSLSVERANPALRLYRREGFVDTGIDAGPDSITMVKVLRTRWPDNGTNGPCSSTTIGGVGS